MNKERILHVNIENSGGNGAFSLVCYLYKYLKEEYYFDFYSMDRFQETNEMIEIKRFGGKVYSANLRKNRVIGHIILPFSFYKFLKKSSYKIVHIHSEVAYKHFLYALGAKCAGIKTIIIHSHSNNIDGDYKKIKYLLHKVFSPVVCKLGTIFIACSYPAAKWMFSKWVLKGDKFHVLHNGIVPSLFRYNEEIRNVMRNKLNVEKSEIVIGHVGALKNVKNQKFIIELVSELKQNKNKYKALLIGDGVDRKMLQAYAKDLGVDNEVIFLGLCDNMAELMQAFDIMIFPSLFEGIPMALIEAQTVGIPIIASDRINKEVKVNGNVKFIPLESDIIEWVDEVNNKSNLHLGIKGYENIEKSAFNIQFSANKLKEIYCGKGNNDI